jgi:poly-gamma-glutamate capsule biosynthesis protein CapA/YwtB (metallophosphatase superfamily)
VFGGDVMVGRGVQELSGAHRGRVFANLRAEFRRAAIVAANLESPLTARPALHRGDPNALMADPTWASVLARAGFSVLSLANNHAGDAGRGGVRDSIDVLRDEGIAPIGVSMAAASRRAGVIRSVGDLRVGLLAFDVPGPDLSPADDHLGVATWRSEAAHRAVARLRHRTDVVAVALHGGTSYSVRPDPGIVAIADRLAGWGVDVVWVSGPHLIQPVRAIDPDRDGRVTVVATSLGNVIFDQWFGGLPQGLLLAVRIERGGVVAWRLGRTTLDGASVVFSGWGTWQRGVGPADQ